MKRAKGTEIQDVTALVLGPEEWVCTFTRGNSQAMILILSMAHQQLKSLITCKN